MSIVAFFYYFQKQMQAKAAYWLLVGSIMKLKTSFEEEEKNGKFIVMDWWVIYLIASLDLSFAKVDVI